MKLADKYVSMPAQSWISRAERRHPPKIDYLLRIEKLGTTCHIGSGKEQRFRQERSAFNLSERSLDCPRMVSA
jgi:hypothetical protein